MVLQSIVSTVPLAGLERTLEPHCIRLCRRALCGRAHAESGREGSVLSEPTRQSLLADLVLADPGLL